MSAMMILQAFSALALLSRAGAAITTSAASCAPTTVEFIVLDGDATIAAIEDDVRANLEAVGVTVTKTAYDRDGLNAAMTAGNFNLAFSETWGPPYDPHSFASSWAVADEAYYAGLAGLQAPTTQVLKAQCMLDVFVGNRERRVFASWLQFSVQGISMLANIVHGV